MKLAHLADPHLGIRQYHRQTSAGVNQRESDVAQAFRAAIDDVIACAPDAIVIAGDLFHSVRPTNAAIVFAFRQLQRLREALAEAPVVLIAGNHDTPRSSETGSILRLFEEIGIHVADAEARRLRFPELDLSILAVPHQALVVEEQPALHPEGSERYQVLVLHGELEGAFSPYSAGWEYGGAIVPASAIRFKEWSYVAWGHFHIRKQVADRAWYAGAPEYTSANIWGEPREERELGVQGKGWLLVDLDTGIPEARPIPTARRVLDLGPIHGEGLDRDEVNAELAGLVGQVSGGIAGQIVRVVAYDVPRVVARELNHAQVREWKADALHFQLDVRPPERERSLAHGASGNRKSLAEILEAYLRQRLLPSEVDRSAFVSAGIDLLNEANSAKARGA